MTNSTKIEKNILEEGFSIAFSDVLETMTGLMVREEENISIIKNSEEFTFNLSGAMILIGDKNGLSTISMKKDTAAILVAYMTGIPDYDLEDGDIFDGIAEIMNLLAGRAKAILKGSNEHFDISPPFTIIGEDHYILFKNKSLVLEKVYYIGDMPMYLKIYFV